MYKDEWVKACIRFSKREADFYSGCRKIHRGVKITFDCLDDSLTLDDAGYTKTKQTLLRKGYLHEESHQVAQELWKRRLSQKSYGSVGFTTYNHFLKNDPNKKSKRASVMGPCIQSVTLSLLKDKTTGVDVFYRTTELFKKFPADLVFLREELLAPFEFDLSEITCHFANLTAHPMYFVTVIPSLEDPFKTFEEIKKKDKYFYDWTVKWTARYLVPEHHRGIAKHAQSMRVHMDANKRISDDLKPKLIEYLRDNHPGYTRDYQSKED